ncbi:MAG: hypothetical protein ACK54Z_02990 [Cyanobacteriota bacterium]
MFAIFCSAANAEKEQVYTVYVDPPPMNATSFFVDLVGLGTVEASLLYIRGPIGDIKSFDYPCKGGPTLDFRAVCELQETSEPGQINVRSVILRHATAGNPPFATPARASGYLNKNGDEVTRYPKTVGIEVSNTTSSVSLFHSDSGQSTNNNTVIKELKYSLSNFPVSRGIDYTGDKYIIHSNSPVIVPPDDYTFSIPDLNEDQYLTLSFLISEEGEPEAPSPQLRRGVFYQTPAPLPVLGAMLGFQFSRKIRRRIKSSAF